MASPPPQKNVAAIIMLNKNTKVKVCSLDGDTDYFDIVAGMLQRDTLAPYLFIICLDYVLRKSLDLMKKRYEAGKGNKQKIPRTNYYGRGLRQWHIAFVKYTCSNRNPAS